MQTILFIDEQYLKSYTPVSAAVDTTLLWPFVQSSQQTDIQPLVGKRLYERLVAAVDTGTVSTDEADLIRLLRDALVWSTLRSYLVFSSIKLRGEGATRQSGEGNSSASLEELSFLRSEAKSMFYHYAERVQQHLAENQILFPEWDGCSRTDNKPTLGMYLPGLPPSYSTKSVTSGISGTAPVGTSGTSGFSGFSGLDGIIGVNGLSGFSGFSGFNGSIGDSGISGISGFSGVSGFNGSIGIDGVSGFSGYSGFSGSSQKSLPSDFNVFTLIDSSKIGFIDSSGAYREKDLQPLTGTITIDNSNEIVRFENNLFITGNFDNAGLLTPWIAALYDCYLDSNDDLQWTSANLVSHSVNAVHALVYSRGYLFGCSRISYPKLFKINAFNLSDQRTLQLPSTPDYLGETTDIKVYKDKIYLLTGVYNTLNPQQFIEVDDNLIGYRKRMSITSTSTLSAGTSAGSQTPFLIHNDELYVCSRNVFSGGYKYKVSVFSLDGVSLRESALTPTTSLFFPHWMVIVNDKLIITTTGGTDRTLARFDAKTLTLEESVSTPSMITDDNFVSKDGWIWLFGEKPAGYPAAPNPELIKVKYNDFTTLTTVFSGYNNSKGSYGGLTYQEWPEGLIGDSGFSGVSGFSGSGISGFSGLNGSATFSGFSGYSGVSGGIGPAGGLPTVSNSSQVSNSTITLADVTGLSFPVIAGIRYKFRFWISYTSPTTTNGSFWTINGPTASKIRFDVVTAIGTTSLTAANALTAYDSGVLATTSAGLVSQRAVITGIVIPSANGSVIARFRSETAGQAIIVEADSFVEYSEY